MSTKTAYVVLEKDFEYNDETYYPSGDGNGCGIPIAGFSDLVTAQSDCDRRNLAKCKEFDSDEWSRYGYDLSELSFTKHAVFASAEELGDLPQIFKEMKLEQFQTIPEEDRSFFFEVYEIELIGG
jgi:hypothetical protein